MMLSAHDMQLRESAHFIRFLHCNLDGLGIQSFCIHKRMHTWTCPCSMPKFKKANTKCIFDFVSISTHAEKLKVVALFAWNHVFEAEAWNIELKSKKC